MIRELEREVHKLRTDNQRLRDENASFTRQVSEADVLQNQVNQLKGDLIAAQEALRQFKNEVARLETELIPVKDRANRAEAIASQLSKEYRQTQVSLAAAEREINALNAKLQEETRLAISLEEEKQHLSVEVISLAGQVKKMPEAELQLHEYIAKLEEALHQERQENAETKHRNQALESKLDHIGTERQQVAGELVRLTTKYEELRREFVKAMAILDSWSGKVAKWWATIRAKDWPNWPERPDHKGKML